MLNLAEQSVFEIRNAILDALGQAVADGALPSEPIPEFKIEVINKTNAIKSRTPNFIAL